MLIHYFQLVLTIFDYFRLLSTHLLFSGIARTFEFVLHFARRDMTTVSPNQIIIMIILDYFRLFTIIKVDLGWWKVCVCAWDHYSFWVPQRIRLL